MIFENAENYINFIKEVTKPEEIPLAPEKLESWRECFEELEDNYSASGSTFCECYLWRASVLIQKLPLPLECLALCAEALFFLLPALTGPVLIVKGAVPAACIILVCRHGLTSSAARKPLPLGMGRKRRSHT